MGVTDMITRVDAICKKYDKYDLDKQKQVNIAAGASDDAFLRLYAAVDADLHQFLQKGETVALETRRAIAVAINAEIRRSKARLLEDIPKLQRLAFKKVKGLSKEELEARSELVIALKERIEAVPDGSTVATKQTGGFTASGSNAGFIFNSTSDGKFDSDYFQHTEDTNAFRQEYEMRKMKQDEGLDDIAEGLHTLKNMAHDMNEELDRQVPLMDEIDDKVDKANSELRNANVQLKDTITKLRSSRNFCCDVILLCIILGIAAYLYNVLK
ncbi:syntaxin-71-like [Apium graveolens]|uniref:syntaxin-71-like n=1 Tax=Apium graveolens TaxID=4045 RepID=UPI003D79D91B